MKLKRDDFSNADGQETRRRHPLYEEHRQGLSIILKHCYIKINVLERICATGTDTCANRGK